MQFYNKKEPVDLIIFLIYIILLTQYNRIDLFTNKF